MRNLAFVLTVAAGLFCFGAAHAYQTPTPDPRSRELIEAAAKSEEVQAILREMGCTKLVWAKVNQTGQIINLQFMPQDMDDDELQNWTRMMSVTIYGMSGQQAADYEAMKKLIYGLETQARIVAKQVDEDRNYVMNEGKDIGMYLQYNLNVGKPDQVTLAGAFLRLTEKTAGYFLYNARGVPMKKSELLKMHMLVDPYGGEDRRKKKFEVTPAIP